MTTPSVETYEKLGLFYLGRPWDLAAGAPREGLTLYDSKDLLTHAVCLGMTGSGKTGLCVCLLEEAAIDGVPALVIDPKGDLGNLMLTFPDLDAASFRPWIDEDAARRKELSPDDFAARQAETWSRGLADWGQGRERIARLRAAVDFAVYTPGSEAGLPLSVLSSFAAPPPAVLGDGDLLRGRIGATAGSLLGLLGVDSDPVAGREAVLLANLLERAWREGRDLDLAALIQQVQQPPFERVGVLPLESFYPGRERFELAARLNNLLASPGFSAWLTGEPLDVDRLLYTADGRPRVTILSIAHLSEAERMFFVSLLLEQVLGWVRGRPGTSSLRALLYMDEVFGYLPPVAEPPSKRPLLTLLKQARAFGLGVVLATQNPVDLDYKALSNVGTWFLGRLQTERDKARVMDGLEGAAAGGSFDRAGMERTLSGLGQRVFVLHNVHEDAPEVFHTRWAMSYLRGPLTRLEIGRLMAERKAAAGAEPAGGHAAAPGVPAAATAPAASAAPGSPAAAPQAAAAPPPEAGRPVLPPEVPEVFLPVAGRPEGIEYRPRLAGLARVHYSDDRRGVEHHEEVALLAELAGPGGPDWHLAAAAALDPERFEDAPAAAGAGFAPLPAPAADPRSYRGWEQELADALYRGRRLELFRCAVAEAVSEPGESERDFRIRAAGAAREERDREVEALREKYAERIATQAERIRRAEQRVDKEREQARSAGFSTVVGLGATVLGALFGSRRLSRGTVGRASTAMRRIGRTVEQRQDVGRAAETLAAERGKLTALEERCAEEVAELAARHDPQALEIESWTVKPRRSDVEVRRVALAWAPHRGSGPEAEPAWD